MYFKVILETQKWRIKLKLLQDTLNGITLIKEEDGSVWGKSPNGNLVNIEEKDGRIWLDVTVFDKEMDDGCETEYLIERIQDNGLVSSICILMEV